MARLRSLAFALAMALPLVVTKAGGQDYTTLLTWPPVTRQTKPWTRWWWHGSAVNKRDLTAEMQKRRAGRAGDHADLRRQRRRGPLHQFSISFLDGDAGTHAERGRPPGDGRGYGDRHGLALRGTLGRSRRRVQEFHLSNPHVE